MRISVAVDSVEGVAREIPGLLEDRGDEVVALHGVLVDGVTEGEPDALWSTCARRAAQDVARGRADCAVVACWTGTGVSIAANKIPGVRAALCTDAATAAGARRWNDANVLALSLRLTSAQMLAEILEAWLTTAASTDPADRAAVDDLEP